MHHIKPMKLFSSIVTCAVFGSTMAVSALPESKSNPINPKLPDCMTGLRNGFLVNQQTGQPMMFARCQVMRMASIGQLENMFAVVKA